MCVMIIVIHFWKQLNQETDKRKNVNIFFHWLFICKFSLSIQLLSSWIILIQFPGSNDEEKADYNLYLETLKAQLASSIMNIRPFLYLSPCRPTISKRSKKKLSTNPSSSVFYINRSSFMFHIWSSFWIIITLIIISMIINRNSWKNEEREVKKNLGKINANVWWVEGDNKVGLSL